VTAFDAIPGEVAGTRFHYVADAIPDDAPHAVREGLVRRRLVVTTGRCPCGATWTPPNRATRRAAKRAGRPLRASVEHAADCPAGSSGLDAYIRWAAS
jgi:hypothetical protein